eukprot:3751732-Pyramimonas_sp.AAC.2
MMLVGMNMAASPSTAPPAGGRGCGRGCTTSTRAAIQKQPGNHSKQRNQHFSGSAANPCSRATAATTNLQSDAMALPLLMTCQDC